MSRNISTFWSWTFFKHSQSALSKEMNLSDTVTPKEELNHIEMYNVYESVLYFKRYYDYEYMCNILALTIYLCNIPLYMYIEVDRKGGKRMHVPLLSGLGGKYP